MGICSYKNKAYNQIVNCNDFHELSLENMSMFGKVLSIYDGDTLTIGIYVWNQFLKTKIRMYGYDSPEMKPKLNIPNRDSEIQKAHAAKDYLQNLIGKDNIVWIQFMKFDKYGRALANLYQIGSGKKQLTKSINDIMIENGHGYKYYGGTKKKN